MSIFLNFGLAWIAVLLMLILLAKHPIRKGAVKKWGHRPFFVKLNRIFRKMHIPIGIFLIAIGFFHGFFSSTQVFSFNLGTICWIVSILLGISFIIRKKLNPIKPWIIFHRFLSLLMVALLVWHIIDVGGIKIFTMLSPVEITAPTTKATTGSSGTRETTAAGSEQSQSAATGTPSVSVSLSSETTQLISNYFNGDVVLKDGTYTGTATAYRSGMTVSVTVTDGLVSDITITATNDDARFYQAAERSISQEIIDSQSLSVDTVSGATFSSVGIINAINDALSGAVVSGQLPELKALPG